MFTSCYHILLNTQDLGYDGQQKILHPLPESILVIAGMRQDPMWYAGGREYPCQMGAALRQPADAVVGAVIQRQQLQLPEIGAITGGFFLPVAQSRIQSSARGRIFYEARGSSPVRKPDGEAPAIRVRRKGGPHGKAMTRSQSRS